LKEVKEGSRTSYYLGQQSFDSLDEIIEQFVDPCNVLLHMAKKHQKFVANVT